MIAACPKCAARYRVERERLKPEGLKLRCSRCESVFRVRPPAESAAPEPVAAAPEPAQAPAPEPQAPAPQAQAEVAQPAPSEPAEAGAVDVLVATPDDDLGKQVADALRSWGLRPLTVCDGVEAMLEIQRRLPCAVVLAADLPRMFGFQICEIVKRNESLQQIGVVLIGAIHHKDRYRRQPNDLYGADAYLEEPDLPEALAPALEGLGLSVGASGSSQAPAEAPAAPTPAAAPPAAAAAPPSSAPAPAPAAASAPADAGDELAAERSRADRLARIIVSDIVLYNEARFNEACAAGKVEEMMEGDLAEGRSLFRDRIDERVRAEKDHLMEELLRVAGSRATS